MLIRLYACRQKVPVKRNQYLFKEGDPVDKIYITGQGQFQQTKSIIEPKAQNLERDLLIQQAATTIQRFHTLFKSRHALKKSSEVRLVEFGAGRMIGDAEAFEGIEEYQTSVLCTGAQGTVYAVNREEFMALKEESEE